VVVVGAAADQAAQFADRVAQLAGITGAAVTAQQGTPALLTVGYSGEPTGEQACDTVRAVRDLPPPEGAEVLVGGRPAGELGLVERLRRGLPTMALLMAAGIMVLLFLAFGSVVLPVKAVLMNVVS